MVEFEQRGLTRRGFLQGAGAGAFVVATGALSLADVRAAHADPANPMPNFFFDKFDRPPGAVGNGWTTHSGNWNIATIHPLSGGQVGLVSASGSFSVDEISVAQTSPGVTEAFTGPDGPLPSGWTARAGSWSVAGGRLVTSGTSLGVVVRDDVVLDDEFTVTATLRTTGSTTRWNGIAFNLTTDGLGVYSYYLLRFANDGRWQVLDVRDSNQTYMTIKHGVLEFETGQDYEVELTANGPGDFSFAVRDASAQVVLSQNAVIPVEYRLVADPAWSGAQLIGQSALALEDRFAVEGSIRATDAWATKWNGIALHIQEGTSGWDYLLFRLAPDGRWQVLRATNSAMGSSSLIASGSLEFEAFKDYWMTITADGAPGEYHLYVRDAINATVLDTVVTVPVAQRLSGGQPGFWSGAGTMSVGFRSIRTEKPFANWRPLQWVAAGGPAYTLPDQPRQVLDVSSPGTCWAGHRVGQALLTEGADQYVAYYAADREMTVAHRDVSASTWTVKGLGSYIGWDSHNYVTMGVDRTGILHVAGNMHAVPLDYHRASTAGDASSLAKVTTMVNSFLEKRVTYPRFLNAPTGELLFSYRDGTAIDGIWYINIYDETTAAWSPYLSSALFDGGGDANAYHRGPAGAYSPSLGPDGRYHMAFMWRPSPGGLQNTATLSYVRSDDLIDWETADGTPVALPILQGQGDIVDPAGPDSGLHNSVYSLGFDAANAPVVAYLRYDDEGSSSIYVAKRISGVWERSRVTNWFGLDYLRSGGTSATPIRIGAVRPLPGGLLRLDTTCLDIQMTAVIDSATLDLVTEVATPVIMPTDVTTVESSFPGMSVVTAGNTGTAPSGTTYVAKWESLSGNRDHPIPQPWPDAVPLKVFTLST